MDVPLFFNGACEIVFSDGSRMPVVIESIETSVQHVDVTTFGSTHQQVVPAGMSVMVSARSVGPMIAASGKEMAGDAAVALVEKVRRSIVLGEF